MLVTFNVTLAPRAVKEKEQFGNLGASLYQSYSVQRKIRAGKKRSSIFWIILNKPDYNRSSFSLSRYPKVT